MTSRERILKVLNHEEPDHVPFDLGGSTWTGISNIAYQNLLKYLHRIPEEPIWADVIQQIVIPSDPILDLLKVDTRGLLPLTSHNWNVFENLMDVGDNWSYTDEWGFTHYFPKKNGNWFTLVRNPMEQLSAPVIENIRKYPWPNASNKSRINGLREKALKFREDGKIVILKGLCAGPFEMHQRVRGMSNALMDPFIFPNFSDKLVGKIADLKIEFWEMALNELADVIDIAADGDDYGTQESQLIDPEHFRLYYKHHVSKIIKTIRKKAPQAKVMFHSCGNVRPLIPDFIEMGIDILNPVHITAAGMEPNMLKRDFGSNLVFWGGGIDTQKILPYGSQEEISSHIKKNLEAFAPGGGFVFTPVHNIQGDVPPQNIIAMWEALMKYGKY